MGGPLKVRSVRDARSVGPLRPRPREPMDYISLCAELGLPGRARAGSTGDRDLVKDLVAAGFDVDPDVEAALTLGAGVPCKGRRARSRALARKLCTPGRSMGEHAA